MSFLDTYPLSGLVVFDLAGEVWLLVGTGGVLSGGVTSVVLSRPLLRLMVSGTGAKEVLVGVRCGQVMTLPLKVRMVLRKLACGVATVWLVVVKTVSRSSLIVWASAVVKARGVAWTSKMLCCGAARLY